MDIGFTEEQELLRDTARKFLDSECPTKFVREMMATETAVTDDFWRRLVDNGWLGITYPEDAGGSGLGLAIVQEIAALHDAKITLSEDADGLGNTFTITFPA